jgi:chaperone BCS1
MDSSDGIVGIVRTSSGLSMSDEQPRQQAGPAGSYSAPFSPESLAGSEVDVANSTWIEINASSKLFPLICGHVHEHAVSPMQSLRCEVSETSGDQTESARRSAATQAGKSNVACGLSIGLGLFKFTAPANDKPDADGSAVELHALHQAVGAPVGCDCGPQTLTNLIVFAPGKGAAAAEVLQSFCDQLVQQSEKSDKQSFKIFRWHTRHNYWMRDATCRARPMESVVLPARTKDSLVNDLDEFLSEDSYDFYGSHGIPYRRSYLFHGTPGSGKTSLITAIAGKYGRNVAYLQACHPELTDDNLKSAVQRAPARSIIVLEDIDGLFDKKREKKISQSPLTFSGLLNALDGIGNPAGQIFILTTNFREQLDDALIRNGRVDMHVEFSHANDEQLASMARQFYPDTPAEDDDDEAEAGAVALLVKALREALGGRPISSAAVQHFFVTQRRSTLEEATANASQVIKDMQERDDQTAKQEEEKKKKEEEEEEKKAKGGEDENDGGDEDEEDEEEGTDSSSCGKGGGEGRVKHAQQQMVVPPIHVHLHTNGSGGDGSA